MFCFTNYLQEKLMSDLTELYDFMDAIDIGLDQEVEDGALLPPREEGPDRFLILEIDLHHVGHPTRDLLFPGQHFGDLGSTVGPSSTQGHVPPFSKQSSCDLPSRP